MPDDFRDWQNSELRVNSEGQSCATVLHTCMRIYAKHICAVHDKCRAQDSIHAYDTPHRCASTDAALNHSASVESLESRDLSRRMLDRAM